MDRDELKNRMWERLTGPKAEAEWAQAVERGVERFLDQKVEAVLPRAEIEAAVRAYLTPDRLVELVRPWAGEILRVQTLPRMAADAEPLSRWVPPEAMAILERILERPGIVNPTWVRAMIKERAVEEILAGTLYVTIRDFSTLIPRMILNALPSVKLGVLGGAIGIGTKVADEIQKRLEPEIKSFLAGGTKRALDRAAEFTVGHLDTPVSRDFRKNGLRFLLGRPAREWVEPLTPEVVADLEKVWELIARHVASREETQRIVSEVLDRAAAEYGALTVREALQRHGVTSTPPYAVWAAASWPALRVVLEANRDWLWAVIDDAHNES